MDLGWKGKMFTWNNRHEDGTFTKERLDRVVANSRWSKLFGNGDFKILTSRFSDHKPLFLKLNQEFV